MAKAAVTHVVSVIEPSDCACNHPACCACRDRRALARKAAKAAPPIVEPRSCPECPRKAGGVDECPFNSCPAR